MVGKGHNDLTRWADSRRGTLDWIDKLYHERMREMFDISNELAGLLRFQRHDGAQVLEATVIASNKLAVAIKRPSGGVEYLELEWREAP